MSRRKHTAVAEAAYSTVLMRNTVRMPATSATQPPARGAATRPREYAPKTKAMLAPTLDGSDLR